MTDGIFFRQFVCIKNFRMKNEFQKLKRLYVPLRTDEAGFVRQQVRLQMHIMSIVPSLLWNLNPILLDYKQFYLIYSKYILDYLYLLLYK